MSPPVRRVADEFLTDPQMVQVNRTEMLSSGVEQIYYMTQEKNKPEVLCKLIDAADDFYGVIFCQMKALVADLSRYLRDRGYKVDCLHGDMSQSARESAMLAFRERRVKVLICTDVAARGLDVKDITHVINYSLPRELDNYVHRIGRTARSGKTGLAMSLVTPSHRHLVTKIERMTKSKMREGVIPSRRDIGLKKVGLLLEPFMSQENFARAADLMGEEWKTAVAGMSGEEVAARFLCMQFPYVFAERKQAAMDKTAAPARSKSDRPERPRMSVQKMHPDDRQFWSDRPPAFDENKGSRMIVERAPAREADEFVQERPQREERPQRAERADYAPRRESHSGFKPLPGREKSGDGGSYEPRGERKKPKHERELSANQLRKRERREERRADKKTAGKANKKFKQPFKKFGKGPGGDQPPRRRSHY
jgi:ATP-dependent RNA helicase DeaD